MKGYAGRFLRVGLSEGSVTEEPLPLDVAMDFIAGRGFGIKYLYDELPPDTILWVSTIRSSLSPACSQGPRRRAARAGWCARKAPSPAATPAPPQEGTSAHG